MQISPAQFVIGKFGGLTKTANALGIGVTTVQGWRDRGSIPQVHWLNIIEAAKAEGQMIDLADFLSTHEVESEKAA